MEEGPGLWQKIQPEKHFGSQFSQKAWGPKPAPRRLFLALGLQQTGFPCSPLSCALSVRQYSSSTGQTSLLLSRCQIGGAKSASALLPGTFIEASAVQSSQPRLLRLSSHLPRQSFLLIKGFGALPAAGSSTPAFAPGTGDVWTTVSIRLRISWFSEHSWSSPLLYISVVSQHRDAAVNLFQGPTLFTPTTAAFWE